MMIKEVKTNDGSTTYYNERVDEHYHSMSGALEEATKKHVAPAEILKRLEKNNGHIVLADVCFGLGYNSIVALKESDAYHEAHVELYAFENDTEIISKIKTLELPKEFEFAQSRIVALVDEASKIQSKPNYSVYRCNDTLFSGSLYLGDMKETLAILPSETVDVIFFDPFSPGKQPELWSETIFSTLFAALKPGGILTTYSCATKIREAMQQAGFKVEDGPVVGRKSPGTLARK